MRRLLAWWLHDDERRAFESEGAELFEARAARDGRRAAARARALDRAGLVPRLMFDRVRRPDGGVPSAGKSSPPERWRRAWHDLGYSVRSLRRTPGLAVTIIVTVGLGLGATTAMVSVIHGVLIAPLPYRDADRLFMVRTLDADNLFPLSVADYRALEAQQTTFESVAAYEQASMTASINGLAERVRARVTTPSYFTLLGQTPIAGRLFDSSDAQAEPRPVILSAPYWRARFGGDPRVVGTSLLLEGAAHPIVGVLAAAAGPLEHDVAIYEAARWPPPTRKGPFFLTVLVRPRQTVSPDAAAAELRAIDRRIFPIWQAGYQNDQATWALINLKARVLGAVGDTLWLVFAGVAGVLLVACTNAASLLVARALSRRRDLAVRAALGASRGRLARELFLESAVLAASAAVLGGAVAAAAIRLLHVFGVGYIPRVDEVRLAGPALWWLLGVSAASVLLMGMLPVLHGLRVGYDAAVGSGNRSMTDGPSARRVRRALVAAQFALATPLLVAAALIAGSLNRLLHVDLGMDTRRLITAAIALPESQYSTPAASHTFWERAEARLRAWPGVDSVAFADSRPLDVSNINNFDLEDHPTEPGQGQPVCPWIDVTADYFATTRLGLVRGRLFDARDALPTAPPVIVVDRAWAHRFFGRDDVIGRRLVEGGCTQCPKTTVVGVVGTVKYLGLDRPDEGTIYTPMGDGRRSRFAIVRTAGDAANLAGAFAPIVHELDPNLAVSRVATVEDLVATSIDTPRYLSLLTGAFALVAIGLSVVGIYGVMTFFVTHHTRDIGIRLALGGSPAGVRRMVVGSGLRVVAAGLAIGIALSWLVGRMMASVLFGVTPTDATAFLSVPVVMMAVAALACLPPARRAARLDPGTVLRDV